MRPLVIEAPSGRERGYLPYGESMEWRKWKPHFPEPHSKIETQPKGPLDREASHQVCILEQESSPYCGTEVSRKVAKP